MARKKQLTASELSAVVDASVALSELLSDTTEHLRTSITESLDGLPEAIRTMAVLARNANDLLVTLNQLESHVRRDEELRREIAAGK